MIESKFLKNLTKEKRERLEDRIHRTNSLINTHGIKYYEDAGELLTGYAYGEFYDWDLYFENIYLSYFGISNYCRTNLEKFLDNQLPCGFVERTLNIVHHRPTDHFKPFLAQTALLGSKQTDNYIWLEGRYYDRLVKYLDYWTWFKDYDKNGLSVWQGAGHSGMDNQWSRCGDDDAQICEGVDLNTYILMEYRAMKVIAQKLGKKEDAKSFEEIEKKLANKINEALWDSEDEFYYDRNERTGELIKVQSIAGFIPLWAGIVPKERAEVIIKKHLLNKETFWLEYPIATYSKKEPDYYQSITGIECNWRGPAWIPTNYMVFHGLMQYGYTEIAEELVEKTFEMVLGQEETREYFNAETGNGEGLNPFWGWSTLAYFMPLELEKKYNPTAIEQEQIEKLGNDYFNIKFKRY